MKTLEITLTIDDDVDADLMAGVMLRSLDQTEYKYHSIGVRVTPTTKALQEALGKIESSCHL